MVFKIICALVLWKNVASALEGFVSTFILTMEMYISSSIVYMYIRFIENRLLQNHTNTSIYYRETVRKTKEINHFIELDQ